MHVSNLEGEGRGGKTKEEGEEGEKDKFEMEK